MVLLNGGHPHASSRPSHGFPQSEQKVWHNLQCGSSRRLTALSALCLQHLHSARAPGFLYWLLHHLALAIPFVQVSHTCTFPSLSSLWNRSSLATMSEEAPPSFPCCTLFSAHFILSCAHHHLLLSFCSRRGKDIFIHNPSGLEWWLDLIRDRETLNSVKKTIDVLLRMLLLCRGL